MILCMDDTNYPIDAETAYKSGLVYRITDLTGMSTTPSLCLEAVEALE